MNALTGALKIRYHSQQPIELVTHDGNEYDEYEMMHGYKEDEF